MNVNKIGKKKTKENKNNKNSGACVVFHHLESAFMNSLKYKFGKW